MPKNRTEPKDIPRLPANTTDDGAVGKASSYSGAQFRVQANARLGEGVSPAGTPYGSFRSRDNDFLGLGNQLGHEGKSDAGSRRSSIVQVVKKHLVQKDDVSSLKSPVLQAVGSPRSDRLENESAQSAHDYSVSHSLLGGDITRNIYKWQEDEERNQKLRRRSKSFSSIMDATTSQGTQTPKLSDILLPGGFRRHHVQARAEREGRTTNIVTSNFLDFLALYGHFAGDVYLDDDEEEEDEEQGFTGERTPLIRRASRREAHAAQPSASTGKAVFLLIKSFVGTGVLFLPRSFYDGGLAFSAVILFIISLFCLHCMLLLVEAQSKIGGSFGDMGMTLYGSWARYLVLSSIVVSQFGFTCAYMIFIAKNLQDVYYGVTDCHLMLPEYWFFIVQLLVYVPVALLRKIKSLSAMALVADVFIILGLVCLIGYNIIHIRADGFAEVQNFNPESFTLFIGTAVFTFEGIGLVIPIVESMKEPEKFPSILSWTMSGITALFIFVGALSYATFGAEVHTVVLSNLPRKTLASDGVQLMYALAIVLSVPLQIFPNHWHSRGWTLHPLWPRRAYRQVAKKCIPPAYCPFGDCYCLYGCCKLG
ncbi:hypothetical protein DSO57_1009106 [Entomophthora muscae]|uniref:Uncharacterized protein n=1 Tax=Entomophthora muscae TaxID=34485 RepID=A0ACC2RXW7_9FUNG|nr:hypothetical protein DSO57_1009106 [Entomophthora muscae]